MLDQIAEKLQETLKNKTEKLISAIVQASSNIQTYLTDFVNRRREKSLRRLSAEVNKPQWGNGELFKQGKESKVSNTAVKTPITPSPIKKIGPTP